MSTDLPRIATAQFPSLPSNISPESRYWRKYKSPIIIKEYASVSHIHFSPVAPHDFAVSASTRVQIYSARSRAVAKTISRFSDITFGAEFRKDGKLIVSGDATGLVQVFDASSRSILRTIDLHKLPVQVTKFSPHDLTTLLTASDDKTVRVWDMPTQKPINTFKGNADYVRTAEFMPSSPSLVVSGGYDGTVRLWDTRVRENGGEVQKLMHEANVERVLTISGTTIVSAGGSDVRVWDLSSGSNRPLKVLQNHAKGVTCLAKNAQSSRLLSGGLDGHLKIYDTTEWKVIHGVKYPNAILSCGVSPDDRHLVVGMSNGLLSVRTRHATPSNTLTNGPRDATSGEVDAGVRVGRSKSSLKFLRGAEYRPPTDSLTHIPTADLGGGSGSSKKLNKWDKLLRQYRYADALDAVLLHQHDKLLTTSLLTTLHHRSALRAALSHRDEEALTPILRFLVAALPDSRVTGVVVDVSMTFLEIYGAGVGGSVVVSGLVRKLKERVDVQIERAKEAVQVDGMLQMLFVGA